MYRKTIDLNTNNDIFKAFTVDIAFDGATHKCTFTLEMRDKYLAQRLYAKT